MAVSKSVYSVGRFVYSIFDFDVQEPLAYARGTATATVRERLNTRAEIALIALIAALSDQESGEMLGFLYLF